MSDLNMKKQIDQNASGLRNKAIKELVAAALPGLIARHPAGPVDIDQLASDAVAIAKVTVRELMLQRLI